MSISLGFSPSGRRTYTLQGVLAQIVNGAAASSASTVQRILNLFGNSSDPLGLLDTVTTSVQAPSTYDSGVEWVSGMWQ